MSHVVELELEVKDLNSLSKACTKLGLELVRDQHSYKWFGRSVGDYPIPAGFKASDLGKCDHAIRIPDNKQAYEIGVVKRKDGRPGYTLLWDFWAGGYGMQAIVGNDGENLTQQYSNQLTRKKLAAKGFRMVEHMNQNGDIQLKAVR